MRSDWPTRGESAGLPQRGLDLRPAAGWPAVRDEPCRTISDSPPLELLLRLGHAAVGGPRRSRCRHARCQSAGARWCRSAPAASATPTRVALHLDRLGRRCHGALACSGPGTVSLAHSGSILISPGPFRPAQVRISVLRPESRWVQLATGASRTSGLVRPRTRPKRPHHVTLSPQ